MYRFLRFFLFSFDAILTVVLSPLPLGYSCKYGVCNFFSAGPVGGVVTLQVGGVITLECGRSMPWVLARVVRWCTCGAVLIIAGAVGCVDFWCVGAAGAKYAVWGGGFGAYPGLY